MTSPTNPTDKLVEALEEIGRLARSDGQRTFDDCIRDLGYIDDLCRAYRSRAQDDGVTDGVVYRGGVRWKFYNGAWWNLGIGPGSQHPDPRGEHEPLFERLEGMAYDIKHARGNIGLRALEAAFAEDICALLALARSGPVEHDREELIDQMADAIQDTMDMDWRARYGAVGVVDALVASGIVRVKP